MNNKIVMIRKWVLTILIPILLTICADVIYLFIFPKIEALFR